MSKIFTPFEEKVRSSMEHYESPYDAKSWSQLDKQLGSKTGSASGSVWVIALVAASLFTGVASYAVYQYAYKVTTAKTGYKVARFNDVSAPSDMVAMAESPDLLNGDLTNQIPTTSSEIASNQAGVASNSSPLMLSHLDKSAFTSHPRFEETNQSTASTVETVEMINKVSTEGNSSDLRFTADVNKACVGYEVNFKLSDSPADGKYLWNFGDGTFSNKPNTTHQFSKSGAYDVSLSITSVDGVIRSNVQRDMIIINPAPAADFEWEFVNDPTDAPTVKIINISDNASEFSWNFGDGKESQEISPVRSYVDKGKHMVALTVSNEYGCTDSKVKYIPVNTEYNLQAQPKIAVGKDIFMPQALKSGKVKFKMTIYQGATPVYETVNKNKGWDGSLPNGTMATAGQYPWIVILYNDRTNEEKYFSGLVTVIP